MNTHDLIRRWADDRNLIEGSNPKQQFIKLSEEMGELASALGKGTRPDIIDAIGDMAVVLTIIASQIGTSFEHCVDCAYSEIKDRKGRMVDGIFVKEL